MKSKRETQSTWFTKSIRRKLHEIFDKIEHDRVQFEDDIGTVICGRGSKPPLVITVNSPAIYPMLATGGSVGAAEAYMEGHWTCDDLTALIRLLLRNQEVLQGLNKAAFKKAIYQLFHWLNSDSIAGSKRNIAAHYDLGNELFETFLDPTLTYSAGYFEHPQSTLEEASIAKLDRICKKLDIQPHDRIIEIGSGWGSFAIHAAKNYGCHVTTTTISENQYLLAKDRVKKEGLENKIDILKQDYRALSGHFDKLVSIEMIEAVGLDFLPSYLKKCADLLKPNGSMLIQSITIADQHFEYAKNNVDFIQRYIFPGGALPSLTKLNEIATKNTNLRMYALEDMTAHYAETLRHWREKFYENLNQVKKLGYDNRFIRMWEYYLCYCESGFDERTIGCVQVQYHKPDFRAPFTRTDESKL